MKGRVAGDEDREMTGDGGKSVGACEPRGAPWLLLRVSYEPLEGLEQRIDVTWLLFYRITLAAVLTRERGGRGRKPEDWEEATALV